ncbi:hypothetical protein D9613_000989 [Agrocybe pediades]|uniref:Nephrocystin 3-like N-terminal domain-containing protein n=1 Tax=Agrocybe pediades TaxID=84607 RepID=A0A8H4VS79_9AGAR|nr:hypothetical protein D9613_000989 [Agrocybe pediades]
MADIIEERRVSPVKRKSTPKIEFEERKKIVFHIQSVEGMPQTGWQPLPSTTVFVESIDTKQSFSTEPKKNNSNITWHENSPTMDLKDSSKVRFEVRSQYLWNKSVLATTEVYDIRRLIAMQIEAGQDITSFFSLVLTLAPSVVGKTGKSKYAMLNLNIRETAVKDRNTQITAIDQQKFLEACQQECLVYLHQLSEKMKHLRGVFIDSKFTPLIDIVLGVAEGVYKTIEDLVTRNINKVTVQCFKAADDAFEPYQSLTARQVAKSGESTLDSLQEILCSAVKSLEAVDRFLRTPDAFTKDKLEFKVTSWIHYFEVQRSGKEVADRPSASNKGSRRVKCPAHMGRNTELPTYNMLEMDLPETYAYNPYERPDLVRHIAEWIYSLSNPRNSPRLHPSKPNVFCLYGPERCGKTELASRLTGCLGELGSLGGYFTFDSKCANSPTSGMTPEQILDALPMTIIHQACTVEPDAAVQIGLAMSKNPGAIHDRLEVRFEKLFVNAMREFDSSRPAAAWNPLSPLVFIIDGIGSSGTPVQPATVRALADFLSSKAVSRLPAYIKFLVICRSETGLHHMLEEAGVGSICEMAGGVLRVEYQTPTNSPSSTIDPSFIPTRDAPSPSAKSELYHPLL